MTARCERVGGLNLGQGLCRVPAPPELLRRASRHIGSANHSYSAAEGTPAFREAVAAKINRYHGIELDPASQVLATIGATGAFNAVVAGLLAPGDGVLLIEPFYGYHLSPLILFDLVPQPVSLTDGDWRLTYDALASAVRDSTKAIVVCTPGNPSGRRYSWSELEAVEQIAEEHDLLVVTDEIYEHIYFDDLPHLAPATVGSLADRTISIGGLSKTFSVPGWRLGYATGPSELIQRARVAADIMVVCAPTPLQDIAAEFLAADEEHYVRLRATYARKLALVTQAFERHDCGVRRPEGAYYALVDLAGHGARNGQEASDLLLHRCQVGTIPYEAFMTSASTLPLVRVCFSLPDAELLALDERLRALTSA